MLRVSGNDKWKNWHSLETAQHVLYTIYSYFLSRIYCTLTYKDTSLSFRLFLSHFFFPGRHLLLRLDSCLQSTALHIHMWDRSRFLNNEYIRDVLPQMKDFYIIVVLISVVRLCFGFTSLLKSVSVLVTLSFVCVQIQKLSQSQ